MTKPICPNCFTSYALRKRLKNDEFVCTHCGFIGKIPSKELIENTKNKIHKHIDEQKDLNA